MSLRAHPARVRRKQSSSVNHLLLDPRRPPLGRPDREAEVVQEGVEAVEAREAALALERRHFFLAEQLRKIAKLRGKDWSRRADSNRRPADYEDRQDD